MPYFLVTAVIGVVLVTILQGFSWQG